MRITYCIHPENPLEHEKEDSFSDKD